MTIKDKLEIALKEDAPFRRDNLPASQIPRSRGPSGGRRRFTEDPARGGRPDDGADRAASDHYPGIALS
jgi:hypothetical protein